MPRSSQSSHQSTVKKKPRKRKQYRPNSFLDCQSLTHTVGFPPQHELISTPPASDFVKDLFLDRFVKEIVKPFQPEKSNKRGGARATTKNDGNAGYFHVMVGGKLVKKRRISASNQTSTASRTEDRPVTDTINDSLARKRKIWKENIAIGSNQCLRLLEDSISYHHWCKESSTDEKSTAIPNIEKDDSVVAKAQPSLIVLAKDIYPPTLCSAIPAMAQKLEVPLLLLPGKASLELGRAMNAKRTSVLIFLSRDDGNNNNNNNNDSGAQTMEGDGDSEKEVRESRASIASFVSFIKEQMSAGSGNDRA